MSNFALNRFLLNVKGITRMLTPFFILPLNRERILRELEKRDDLDYIKKRVDYYCQMCEKITLDKDAKTLDFLRWTHKSTAYFLTRMNMGDIFRKSLGRILPLAM